MLPYEIKREQSLEILAKFVEQHPELKEFVDLMMQFDSWKEDNAKPNGTIQIDFGKRKKEKSFTYLSTALSKPKTFLKHWKEDPQITITNTDNHLTYNGCMLNLNLIKDLTVQNHDHNNTINRRYEFKYHNIGEYSIEIRIKK